MKKFKIIIERIWKTKLRIITKHGKPKQKEIIKI